MIDKKTPKKLGTFLLKIVPYIIAIASAVTAITPNQSDDELLAAIKQIANVLALNVGHNSGDSSEQVSECKADE